MRRLGNDSNDNYLFGPPVIIVKKLISFGVKVWKSVSVK